MWEPGVVRGLGQGRAPRSWGVPWGEQGKLSEGQVVGAGLHQALFSAGATLRVPGHLVHAWQVTLDLTSLALASHCLLPPGQLVWATALSISALVQLWLFLPLNGEWENHPFPDTWVGRRASLRPHTRGLGAQKSLEAVLGF